MKNEKEIKYLKSEILKLHNISEKNEKNNLNNSTIMENLNEKISSFDNINIENEKKIENHLNNYKLLNERYLMYVEDNIYICYMDKEKNKMIIMEKVLFENKICIKNYMENEKKLMDVIEKNENSRIEYENAMNKLNDDITNHVVDNNDMQIFLDEKMTKESFLNSKIENLYMLNEDNFMKNYKVLIKYREQCETSIMNYENQSNLLLKDSNKMFEFYKNEMNTLNLKILNMENIRIDLQKMNENENNEKNHFLDTYMEENDGLKEKIKKQNIEIINFGTMKSIGINM
jgi:hypothetical protein